MGCSISICFLITSTSNINWKGSLTLSPSCWFWRFFLPFTFLTLCCARLDSNRCSRGPPVDASYWQWQRVHGGWVVIGGSVRKLGIVDVSLNYEPRQPIRLMYAVAIGFNPRWALHSAAGLKGRQIGTQAWRHDPSIQARGA
jgi:hypothetical protein